MLQAAPRIYLASSFSAFDDATRSLLPLRAKLKDRGTRLGAEVVLAEERQEIAAAGNAGEHMKVLEGCADLAERCDAFFGVVYQRHGERIRLGGELAALRAEVSIFEAELLAACMSNKPVAVVIVRDAPPGEAMAAFLALVRSALGDRILQADESGVAPLFDDFARSIIARKGRPPPWLLDPLSGRRIHQLIGRESVHPQLSFLGGVFRRGSGPAPDIQVIDTVLDRLQRGPGHEGLTHIARLSYLWAAMREFAKDPRALPGAELNPRFQQALGLWNSSAAWYGLHGAHPMGCLATLNELAFSVGQSSAGQPPHGARSSAYYSIGAALRAPPLARRFFRQSVALATKAIEQSQRRAGYSMRASARARLAALGDRLLYFDALADYRHEIKLRERNASSGSELGEARTEYAYALGRQPWRRREALAMMREGVGLMSASPDLEERAGFLIRAERKFAELLYLSGEHEEALLVANRARERSIEHAASDQTRQIDDLLARMKGKVPRN